MTKEEVRAYIATQKLAVVSSVAQGKPQSALVGFAVTENLEIVFDTVEQSRKAQNLFANTACSLVIGLDGPITVQYEGTAEQYAVDEDGPWKETYFQAWPDGPERMNWPGLLYFVVTPTWIRYSDFSRTPRVMEEFTF